jgi:hypothetical protein
MAPVFQFHAQVDNAFDTAAVTITGIELAQKIKKHQFKMGKLSLDQELLPRFGQLYSLPEIFGRPQNADRIRPRGFAPEVSVTSSPGCLAFVHALVHYWGSERDVPSLA